MFEIPDSKAKLWEADQEKYGNQGNLISFVMAIYTSALSLDELLRVPLLIKEKETLLQMGISFIKGKLLFLDLFLHQLYFNSH